MREIKGDIWDYHKQGHWIVITTNGFVRRDGACVMGRGVAKQAAMRFPQLPFALGKMIKAYGNRVYYFDKNKIITFPVKHNWWERAGLNLIARSARELKELLDTNLPLDEIYTVRPGCGNGQLDWKDVKPILEQYFDDRFVIVEKK